MTNKKKEELLKIFIEQGSVRLANSRNEVRISVKSPLELKRWNSAALCNKMFQDKIDRASSTKTSKAMSDYTNYKLEQPSVGGILLGKSTITKKKGF